MGTSDNRGLAIAAATDGACSGNPGPGGWGALIKFEDGTIEEFGGHEQKTTNNRMELLAAIIILKKLKNLPRHPNLKIKTDSKYLINGLSSWMDNWKRKNWHTSSGKPVLNQDLWKELDIVRLNDVSLEYVKGHSGDPDNERADQIAVSFSKGNFPSLKSTKTSQCNQIALVENLKQSNNLKGEGTKSKRKDHPIEEYLSVKYQLTLQQIAELINQPMTLLQQKIENGEAINLALESIPNGFWRLRLLTKVDNHDEIK